MQTSFAQRAWGTCAAEGIRGSHSGRRAASCEEKDKDIAFDAALDSFPGLDKLDRTRPVIFACNGAECWKSYKASKAALAKGFTNVHWFRGGLPEWNGEGLPVERARVASN